MDNSDKKYIWLAVMNVYAASRKAGSVWKTAESMLNKAGVPYEVMFTGNGDNAVSISQKAAAMGYRSFIAVGGDGTVHDVLNGIMSAIDTGVCNADISEFTLGVLPVGSGNDWVKSTGIPCDVRAAVNVISAGRTARQDIVKASILTSDHPFLPRNVSYMVNVGGVGLDARVCEIVNRKKKQGRGGKQLYVSALVHCIRHRVPAKVRIICDGEVVFDGNCLSVAFGIGKYSGGGMRQTPLAVLDDGYLDVTVIPDIPLLTIAKEVPRLFTGTFHKVAALTQARCREVILIPEKGADPEPVELDGEVVGNAPVKLEVLERQINILVP